MSLTAQQLVLQLAGYCGVTSLNPNSTANTGVLGAKYPPNLLNYAISAVNGALQEIHNVSPCSQYYRRVGAILQAPAPVTVTVTHNSNICSLTGWQPWMAGCSIRIDGNPVVNELISPGKLRRPYDGPSASNLAAIVYNDCIIQKSDVVGIRGPIELPQIRLLDAPGSREQFYQYEWNQVIVDDYGRGWARVGISAKIPAQPRAFLVDTEATDNGMQIRLQVLPVPDQQYLLHYGVITNAISITTADVVTLDNNGALVLDGSNNPVDPETYFNIPGAWDESVLLPMALKRFSAMPNFGNGNPLAAQEIDRQHKAAVDIIQSAAPNHAPSRIMVKFR